MPQFKKDKQGVNKQIVGVGEIPSIPSPIFLFSANVQIECSGYSCPPPHPTPNILVGPSHTNTLTAANVYCV